MPPSAPSKGFSPRRTGTQGEKPQQSAPSRKRLFLSNLQSFLAHAAPSVPATDSGFHLSQLWESLEDCSAFGVEVPIKEDWQDEGVTQVYAPYLSALQIFRPQRLADRLAGYGSDEDSSPDVTTSEESSACSSASSITQEGEEDGKRILPPYAEICRAKAGLQRNLIFEHFERSSPHLRPPLTDQIRQLAEEACPQLLTLSSADLHPFSWLAISWTPIYRIPAGRTLHDVPASFLTYHSLSTPLQGPERVPASLPRGQQGGGMLPVGSNTAGETGHDELQECGAPSKAVSHQLVHASAPAPPPLSKGAAAVLADRQQRAPHKQAFLLPFGFVPCKATGRIWMDRQNAPVHAAMLCAALAWTQQLGVQHPDQAFFAKHLSNHQWDVLS